MFNSLRSHWPSRTALEPTRVPPGVVAYAIGDIHGRLDLLQAMVAAIRSDAAAVGTDRSVIVALGDYIDRGPDSLGVIKLLIELETGGEFDVHALKGNHEDTLLGFLDDPAGGPAWVQYGGAETLASYGVQTPRLRTDMQAWAETREALCAAMPPDHVSFFRSLELAFELGDYFFVHAGVRPNVALDRQAEQDMLWIRQEFLDATPNWSKAVVHGHTPADAPHLSARRIGLDTGAYATGVLSAVRLIDKDRKIIQVSDAGPSRRGPAV